jgi:hypothetical protein
MSKPIVAFDSQRLGTVQACPERYRLRFEENLDMATLGDGIRKGSLSHLLLASYYRRKMENGNDSRDAGMWVIKNYQEVIKSVDYDISDIQADVLSMFAEYVRFYGPESWVPIGVEEPFSVPVYEDEELIILYEGLVDLRISIPGMKERPWVDHKTGSRRQYPDNLDNQFIGYSLALGETTGFVNAIEFKKDPDKFHRSPLPFDATIKKAWLDSLVDTAREFLVYELTGHWPRRIRSCNADKFPCIFRDICKGDERTQKWVKETRFRKVPQWDVFTRDDKKVQS